MGPGTNIGKWDAREGGKFTPQNIHLSEQKHNNPSQLVPVLLTNYAKDSSPPVYGPSNSSGILRTAH